MNNGPRIQKKGLIRPLKVELLHDGPISLISWVENQKPGLVDQEKPCRYAPSLVEVSRTRHCRYASLDLWDCSEIQKNVFFSNPYTRQDGHTTDQH